MNAVVKGVFAWTALVILSVGVALAQESHVVTYEGDANENSKRPDFTGTVVAIDFDGPAAEKATDLFHHLGAKRFNVGKNVCVSPELVVVCVRFEKGSPMTVSSSGSSSSFGSRGGFSTGGSFSGSLYPITLTVFLVVNHGATYETVPLGTATCVAGAGSGSEWTNSYGRGGGGSYQSNSSGGLSLGPAISQDMAMLLEKWSWRNALVKANALGTSGGWVPGANETIKKYFAR